MAGRGQNRGMGRAAGALLALMLGLNTATSTARAAEEPANFEAYRALFSMSSIGGRGSASLLFNWTQHYRGAMPHAAFAMVVMPDGRTVWQFASGRASPEAAREAVQTGCDQAAAAILPGTTCRLVALNGSLIDAPPGTPSVMARQDVIGPFRAAPFLFRHGPEAAQGVVIWSHGYGGPTRDQRNALSPGFLTPLNDAGWDVLRFDRDPMEDDIIASLPRLVRGLGAVRSAGYRRIVLAGHSRGGWHSVLAAGERPDWVEAVIATAPAAHGESSNQNNLAVALGDFRRMLASLPPDRVRLAVVVFEGDPFDPNPEQRAGLVGELAATRSAPTLGLWPTGVTGHGGAHEWRFTARYAACLLSFVQGNAGAAPRGLRREACGGG